ncbi:hypothetical protein HMPREF3170_10500 [Corynebacterium sp. HMSC08D02]|uniref:Rib/alpha-like domain-containing protein n=1 Tax=Corynebacterium sp. HMSC08D02 TaxID=1581138 RepID=UPI0008A100A4|nr:Rib/alpha-like domain-containing protein [Corynebacterium sp. HMSC08D02]OFT28093.1 hypothetical protein HMPREF3170_10500 [Corynebacterium sp. HMSC08D02]
MRKSITARRGTSIAAAALSFALVAPLAQPVAFAQDNPPASAAPASSADKGAQQAAANDADPYGAIYSPGISGGKHTISGIAMVFDQLPGSSWGPSLPEYGTALPAANSGTGANFKGATVYAQWFEKPDKSATGGEPNVASPIYKTTVNEDGTFAINMRPYLDPTGQYREFWAQYAFTAGMRGQRVKIWVDGYDRNEFRAARGYGERVMPDGTVIDTTGGVYWNTPTGYVSSAHQLFVRKSKPEEMLGSESGWREVSEQEKKMPWSNGGAITGKAYWNLNQGLGKQAQKDLAGSSGDRKVKGLKVVGAYLSDKAVNAITKYAEENRGSEFQDHTLRGAGWDIQDETKLQAWIRDQIKQNPDWIAEKVTTTTDGNGEYRLQFKGTYGILPNKPGYVPEELAGTVAKDAADGTFTANTAYLYADAKHVNWDWMYVEAPDLPEGTSNMGAWRGNVWQGLTSTNWGVSNLATSEPADQFDMRGMQAVLRTPNYNISSWDMVLFPNRINFEVAKYDSKTKFARKGDSTFAQTASLPAADMNALYEVEWTDSNGKVLQVCKGADSSGKLLPSGEGNGLTASSAGTLPNCPVSVPEDLKEKTIYTATLYGLDENGARIPLGSDSFTAVVGIAAEVGPEYKETPARIGEETSSKPATFIDLETGEAIPADDKRLEGATFEVVEDAIPEGWVVAVDPKTGAVTFTAGPNGRDGHALKPGDIEEIPVRVTYSDGTTNGAIAPVRIAGERDEVEPAYDEQRVVPGTPASTEPKFFAQQLDGTVTETAVEHPEGVSFKKDPDFETPAGYTVDVDPATGKVTVTAPEKPADDTAEVVTVPVVVTYKDGTEDTVEAVFKLDTDGDGEPDVTDKDDDGDGIDDVDEEKAGTKSKDANSAPSSIKDIDDATVTVREPITPIAVVVEKLPIGGSVEVTGLPDGLKYNKETGQIEGTPTTPTPKDEPAEVTVKVLGEDGEPVVDKDGKPVEKTFKITVQSQAGKYDPQGKDQEVAKNSEPKAEDSIANKDKLPEGTKYTWKDAPKTDTSGDKKAVVVVTYPDGSTDEVPVTVKVAKDQAEQFDPEGKDQTVETGKKPEPKDNVKDADKLPKGTTFAYKKEPDTSTAGDKPVTVIVTYPDGSTDEVQATVKVEDPKTEDPKPKPKPEQPKKSDADTYEPQVQDKTVAPNEVPEAKDHVTNVDELPEGTTFEYEQAPDTSTEGDKPVTIVVTYPDGTTDKVNANVKVQKNATDADKNDPQGQDQKVETGGTPDAKGNIKDADKLPKGTSFKYKETPDTSKPGVYDVTVVVTYPDGSTDEVQTTITVGTDAERFVPEYDKVTGVPVDGEKNTNDPFGTKAPVKSAEAKKPEGAEKWAFTPQDNGVLTAKAPSMTDVSDEFKAKLPELKSTDVEKRWDKFFETFTPFARPAVEVDFTYEDDSRNSATANFDLIGKDGNSLLDPNGDFDGDGVTNEAEVKAGSDPANDGEKPDTTAPTVNPITAGDTKISGKGDRPNETIIVTLPNGKELEATTDANGNWSVNLPKGVELKQGDKVNVRDGHDNKAKTVTVAGKVNAGACAATAVGFGLPLIAFLPLGLASQIQIPVLSDLAGQVEAQLQAANTRIQQQAGIFNPEMARQAERINAQLRTVGADLGMVVAGIALIAAGVLAGTFIYDACKPGGPSSSVKDLELKGSSGKTTKLSSEPAKKEGKSTK